MRLIRLFKNDLAREVRGWVGQEIITPDQAEQICAQYGIDYQGRGQRSLGYYLLLTLGYLFIALAAITLIGANWEQIPRAVRMAGLLLITLTAHGFAFRKYLRGYAQYAVTLFLFANMLYGASIILIAQIYHLGEHMPDGVFWWALGCLPFALLLNNHWLALQSLLLALIWMILEASYGFYPPLFILFLGAALWILYKGKPSLLLLFCFMIGLFLWLELSLSEYWSPGYRLDVHAEQVILGVGLGIVAYALSLWLNRSGSAKAKDYAAFISLWSLRGALILMFVLSFESPWEELIRAHWKHQLSMSFIAGLLSVLSLGLAIFSKRLFPLLLILVCYLLSVAALLLTHHDSHAIYFQLLYNLLLILWGVYLIIQGIHRAISHYFFLGVVTILLTALMRYIDLIGDYTGGAILFIVFAAILLGAARYWRFYKARKEAR
ncbi:DUF2157 domain-containing protein [Dongshaea marina]|uniref:DUF2157 domain-containing protein n=1 Tax=Dongshaea marina TaxID=2047966 RepID=UPI000D3E0A79|nr:DUF2157 domain-containing protein [Dongshaea marina]